MNYDLLTEKLSLVMEDLQNQQNLILKGSPTEKEKRIADDLNNAIANLLAAYAKAQEAGNK